MARQPGRGARSAADAAATDVVRSAPAPGGLLDGRYRLSRQLPGPDRRWAAVDEVLDRPVEIRFVEATGEQLSALLAGAAARLDGRWLRLLDAGAGAGRSWVVVEDPCRPSLADRVADAPVDPQTAVTVALATARALAAAGSAAAAAVLTPDRVYLDDAGVRLDTPAVQTLERPAGGAGTGGEPETVRAVGRLLLFALTGVWTGAPVAGLPAPLDTASPSPRRFRGGVPRRIDAVTLAAATGAISRLAELITALEALPLLSRREGPRPALVVARRVAGWVLPPVALALVGLLAWTVGSNLGGVPGADQSNPVVRRLPSPSPRPALVWHTPPRVRSFDPAGDGSEDPSGARYAVDGDPVTFWRTDVYRTAEFGGLKPGVGLLVDLGRSRAVGSVVILFTRPGVRLQVRAGDRPPSGPGSLRSVAGRQLTARHAQLRVDLRKPVTARYWLVWLTRLPAEDGGYAEGIREIRLERPRGH